MSKNWINVDDERPEFNHADFDNMSAMLTVYNGKVIGNVFYCKMYSGVEGCFVSDMEGYDHHQMIIKNVTHYMPLPDPPTI